MRVIFLIALCTAELCAQEVVPPRLQGPIVGFVNGPGPLEITPIMGIAAAASLGEPLGAHAGSTKLYLPPRQQYALLEAQAAGTLELWNLRDSFAVQALAGSMPHPDIAAFSPMGTAAVLYSSQSSTVQVIADLPRPASAKFQVATSPAVVGTISNLCVSDDGTVILARNNAGQIFLSAGGADWRLMPWSYVPSAWSFIANSHDLALAEAKSQAVGVLLFPQVDGPNRIPEAITGNLGDLNLLTTTSDGSELIAANTATSQLWSIAIKTATTTSVSVVGGLNSLLTLRDGHTFLLSRGDDSSFSLLKVAGGSAEPAVLVHPGKSNDPLRAVH